LFGRQKSLESKLAIKENGVVPIFDGEDKLLIKWEISIYDRIISCLQIFYSVISRKNIAGLKIYLKNSLQNETNRITIRNQS